MIFVHPLDYPIFRDWWNKFNENKTECDHPREALLVNVFSNAMSYPNHKKVRRLICRKCSRVLEAGNEGDCAFCDGYEGDFGHSPQCLKRS